MSSHRLVCHVSLTAVPVGEVAVLLVLVCGPNKLGYWSAPVECLRPGTRVMHLHHPKSGKKLALCDLMCKIRINEY